MNGEEVLKEAQRLGCLPGRLREAASNAQKACCMLEAVAAVSIHLARPTEPAGALPFPLSLPNIPVMH